jgi:hypothetical protein
MYIMYTYILLNFGHVFPKSLCVKSLVLAHGAIGRGGTFKRWGLWKEGKSWGWGSLAEDIGTLAPPVSFQPLGGGQLPHHVLP